MEGLQASKLIRGRFPGRYGAPLTRDTTTTRAVTTAGSAANADHEGVQDRVLWGEDPHVHLEYSFPTAREPPVPSPFQPGYET